MIDPTAVSTIRVGELPSAPFNLTDNIPHEVGVDLKKGTIEELSTFISAYIGATDAVGFRAISVTDGQTLPTTAKEEFILVGKGTFYNVAGGSTIVCTEELNAIVSNGSFWFIGVEIPVNIELSGITQFIRQGFTDNTPSEDVVYDALALKVPYTGATSNVNLGEFQLSAGQITFDQTPTQTAGVGVMRWNDTDGTLDLGLKGGNVTLQLGQEQIVRVVNKTGSNLTESGYQAVYTSGAQGQRLKVDLALANSDLTSAGTLGLITENILVNEEGFVTTNGLVRGINTTGSLQSETWADGDILYLSPITAGKLTNIKPTAPQHSVTIGVCVYAHITQGAIFVKVDNGYELEELHNVLINTAINNDALIYESETGLWKNKTISSALGYTPENIVNKSDSYTVSSSTTYASTKALVDGLAIKANDSNVVHLTGNETVNGTKTFPSSPLFDLGARYKTATLGYQSINAFDTGWAFGTGSTTNQLNFNGTTGYSYTFPNADGTLALTSNLSAYQPLLTNPITGTGTTNYLPKFTGTSALGNSLIYDNGTNVLIGTTTDNGNKLRVNGSGYFDGIVKTLTSTGEFLRNDASVAGATQVINIYNSAGTRRMLLGFGNTSSESLFFSNDLNGDIIIRTNAVERLNVSSAGVVKINNLAGTGTRTVVADASGNLSTTVGYKVYTALLSQSGTSAPTATVLENTLGGTVVWTRSSTGIYLATLGSAFTTNKTFITMNTGHAINGFEGASWVDNSNIQVVTYLNGPSYSDGRLSINGSFLEIRVYN